ncbi:uncharacterized protein CLUP02_02775 [Colletotrichum lupini]|uniref:Uncharacterized protein n=1 Tax=Colletotrichum lupini TaxID=145971 RepID=A0A9Q8SHN4_9PEZI|nr:uncharacterized protein CLUP02_02775 [Colletotrichum lupini]UQC77308.1 hypothetical protein CLUP02_02775 [Colletotrichum lupini]
MRTARPHFYIHCPPPPRLRNPPFQRSRPTKLHIAFIPKPNTQSPVSGRSRTGARQSTTIINIVPLLARSRNVFLPNSKGCSSRTPPSPLHPALRTAVSHNFDLRVGKLLRGDYYQ